MKLLLTLVFFSTTVAVARAADSLPEMRIDVNGARYLYSDDLIITTGGGVTMHVFLIHTDGPQYSAVKLRKFKYRAWPSFSTGTVEVPLACEGTYLVREMGGKMVVNQIAAETPSTADPKAIEAYLIATVEKPPFNVTDN